MAKTAEEVLKLAMSLTPEDAQALFDTGVFNQICKGYLTAALDDADADIETRQEVLAALQTEFELTSAAEALRYGQEH